MTKSRISAETFVLPDGRKCIPHKLAQYIINKNKAADLKDKFNLLETAKEWSKKCTQDGSFPLPPED